jgi:hypothetical protein
LSDGEVVEQGLHVDADPVCDWKARARADDVGEIESSLVLAGSI